MECEKIRDRFSSLLEKELAPLEEKTVREHLASCLDCQKELQQFEKTIRWLHSVKEAEVPDGFLSGIYKKMEERKRKVPFFSVSLKLPAQAFAMVTIVFLVLYLTKIMPVERLFMKEAKHTKPSISEPLSEEKKGGPLLAKKEMEKETATAKPPLKEIEKSKIPASEAIPVPPEKKRIEIASVAKERATPAGKPPQEIILRTSDRQKTLAHLDELLQQFGGKIVTTEGNTFFASLPATTFTEFEKKLLGLSSPEKADQRVQEKDIAENHGMLSGARRLDRDEKAKKPSALVTEQEDHIAIRILLLEE